jgi:hypothetical protein
MFALLAIAEAPVELRESYTRIIRAVASESARAALEELMMTHLKDAFVDGLLDQGRAEGRAEGEAHLLLRIMTARGLDIPEHVRVRVAECTDTAILEAWADRAATATSVADVFEV